MFLLFKIRFIFHNIYNAYFTSTWTKNTYYFLRDALYFGRRNKVQSLTKVLQWFLKVFLKINVHEKLRLIATVHSPGDVIFPQVSAFPVEKFTAQELLIGETTRQYWNVIFEGTLSLSVSTWAASFPGVSTMENGKRHCTSHQGVSRNGPWERLAWTQRTLGRVNDT